MFLYSSNTFFQCFHRGHPWPWLYTSCYRACSGLSPPSYCPCRAHKKMVRVKPCRNQRYCKVLYICLDWISRACYPNYDNVSCLRIPYTVHQELTALENSPCNHLTLPLGHGLSFFIGGEM